VTPTWYLPKFSSASDARYWINQYATVRLGGPTQKKSRSELETENRKNGR